MNVSSAKSGRRRRRDGLLLDPVGDRLGIAQAVRMMRRALLDHHGDPAAQLVIPALDGQRMAFQQEVETPADVQKWHVAPGQLVELGEGGRPDRGVVGVDARHLVGIDRGPVVLVDAPLAHADERGLLRQPVLLGQVRVPGVPRLVRVGCDERDVEAPAEQLDLGLGLVVPVTPAPGPGVAGAGSLGTTTMHRRCPLGGALTPNRSSASRLNGLTDRVCSSITKS